MSTSDMPNTNQGSDYTNFSDRIPQNMADIFQKAEGTIENQVKSNIQKTLNSGMSQ